jgi:glucan biosynthesis protein C
MMPLRPQMNSSDQHALVTTNRTHPTTAADFRIAPNINSVRGLACLLIVALHVVGDAESNGLHLPMTSRWHYIMISIEFLRIPLFTALSGYLYAGNRVTSRQFSRFWVKKWRRLVIPFLFTTVVVWWLRGRALGDGSSLLHALLFEYGHLWYLQALLILFAGISVADAFLRRSSGSLVLAGLIAIMVTQSGQSTTTFFGIAGAFYLAPYFLFGIILRERPEWLQNPRAARLALGIILIVLTDQQLGLYGLIDQITLLQLPAAVAGMAGVVFLLQKLPSNALLARIGTYSYTIYLWHIVASAGTRDALLKAGVTAVPAIFAICFTVGVIAPIVLYHIARRIPLVSVAVTGEWWLPLTGKLWLTGPKPAEAHPPLG